MKLYKNTKCHRENQSSPEAQNQPQDPRKFDKLL